MNHHDHVALLRGALDLPANGGRWAELGSGEGAFTLALADLLGPIELLSVDLDRRALERQRSAMRRFPAASVTYRVGDFTDDLEVAPGSLDGVLMANSLHYLRTKEALLRHLITLLAPGGRLVLIEYDTDTGNQWVPYPLSYRSWAAMAPALGLTGTRRTGSVPSRFLGSMYSAVSLLPPAAALGR